MTQYMFLLYDGEEWNEDEATAEDWEREMRRHGEFAAAVEAAGAKVTGGEALAPTSTASTVRNGGDTSLVTDGPFLETREVLGGFYLIEAADLDQALALAKLCPAGTVEVRPVMDTSGEA